MAANKRTSTQINYDRTEIARLYLRGWSQNAIGDKLEMTQQMVSYDLKALQKEWQKSALVDIDAAKSHELARIDELERTYWTEWEASKEERETTTTKAVQGAVGGDKLPKRQEATIRKEKRLGDPAYLRGVQWCIERRSAIMGFDAPKENKTNLSGELDLKHSIDPDQYNRAIASLVDALGIGVSGTGDQRSGEMDAAKS